MCIRDRLEEGQGTVGTLMNVSHISATPVGMEVTDVYKRQLLMSAFVFCSCGQKDTKEAQDQTEETAKDTKEDSKTKETKDTDVYKRQVEDTVSELCSRRIPLMSRLLEI